MGQRSIRFPDDLEARLVAAAESDGRSFSNLVVRALERVFLPQPGIGEFHEAVKAADRASMSQMYREGALERAAGLAFECPHGRCSQRGPLGTACPVHPNLKFKEPA